MLYWNTVNSLLKTFLITLMTAEELIHFRLVGGTALSLYLGHRLSVDIDLFTDANYGFIDFDAIEVDIPTKVHQCSALKYPIYSGAKYASQTGQDHH